MQPFAKKGSAATLNAHSTRQGARPESGMRRNVPIAPLLAPQPKAREKKPRPSENGMPLPAKAHSLHRHMHNILLYGIIP